MSRSRELLAATGIRGRVAIANVCLAQLMLRESDVDIDVLILHEFYWDFVEQDLMEWNDRRKTIAALDAVGRIQGPVGEALEVVDLASTGYLFGKFPVKVDRPCEEVANLFVDVFPNNEKLLSRLSRIVQVTDTQRVSRWAYLDAWRAELLHPKV